MIGARSARRQDLPAQRLAGAKYLYPGVAPRNAVLHREVLHGHAVHLDALQGVAVSGGVRVVHPC